MKLIGLVFSSIVLIASAPHALAATCRSGVSDSRYIYAASSCKYQERQSLDSYFALSGGNSTSIRNADTSSRRLVCPVIRHDAGPAYHCVVSQTENFCAWQDGGLDKAYVHVDGNIWESTDANFHWGSWDGETFYTAPTPTLTLYGSTDSTFSWGAVAAPAYANYAITISAEPDQYIRSYEVNECSWVEE